MVKGRRANYRQQTSATGTKQGREYSTHVCSYLVLSKLGYTFQYLRQYLKVPNVKHIRKMCVCIKSGALQGGGKISGYQHCWWAGHGQSPEQRGSDARHLHQAHPRRQPRRTQRNSENRRQNRTGL